MSTQVEACRERKARKGTRATKVIPVKQVLMERLVKTALRLT